MFKLLNQGHEVEQFKNIEVLERRARRFSHRLLSKGFVEPSYSDLLKETSGLDHQTALKNQDSIKCLKYAANNIPDMISQGKTLYYQEFSNQKKFHQALDKASQLYSYLPRLKEYRLTTHNGDLMVDQGLLFLTSQFAKSIMPLESIVSRARSDD